MCHMPDGPNIESGLSAHDCQRIRPKIRDIFVVLGMQMWGASVNFINFLLRQLRSTLHMINYPKIKHQEQQSFSFISFCDKYSVIIQMQSEIPPITYEAFMRNYSRRVEHRSQNILSLQRVRQREGRNCQIKTIQKFISKLKTEQKNYEGILIEMQTLNLQKYLEEIAAVVANSVTERQVPFYTDIASKLNQDYDDVAAMFAKQLGKTFLTLHESVDDNKARLKTILLFTTELFVCGFAFSFKEIKDILLKLVKSGSLKKTHFTCESELKLFAFYYNCQAYGAFLVNYSLIFTNVLPKWAQKWREEGLNIPVYPEVISPKTKQEIVAFFGKYMENCVSVLNTAAERIKQIEESLRENLRMSGQFNKQFEAAYNDLKDKFHFTRRQLEIIESTIDYPDLSIPAPQIVEVGDIMRKYINKMDDVEIFQIQFERELYESLPNCVVIESKTYTDEQYKALKERIDSCKNKVDADQIAKDFQEINNKKTRKQLAKDILDYRKEYHLVTPFLCRIVAIIQRNWRDIGDVVNEVLFSEYDRLKDNSQHSFLINDKKSRNLKYICEFVKFNIVDPERAIACIQHLIDDLNGHNIDLLIAALESVGRFLYLSNASANKFIFLLSKLENVVKQRSFPLFTTSQLLNSINLLKPHIEVTRKPQTPKSAEQLEAETVFGKDVIKELNPIIEGTLRLIKKQEGLSAVKASLIKQIQNYDYLGSFNYAYLLDELNIPQISDYVVQKTIEKLQSCAEHPNKQVSLLWSRFFGELYSYDLVKRNILYKCLENLLNIKGFDLGIVNIVCTVLQTCDLDLNSNKIAGMNQKFMFLVAFKKFIHRCAYIPMLEQFKIIDVYNRLEPNLTTIQLDVLDKFLQECNARAQKERKQIDLTDSLDLYMETKNLKEYKPKPQSHETENSRRCHQEEEENVSNNAELIQIEYKKFESELHSVMQNNMRDFSGRIAKPIYVEKIIERRKDKKKVRNAESKMVVIGRSWNKFIKKDVVYKCMDPAGKNGRDDCL